MQVLEGSAPQGGRLDVCVAALAKVTRSRAAGLIQEGLVTLSGVTTTKAGAKVAPGQPLTVQLPPPRELRAIAQDLPLDVVYQDADLAVINKPRGMVVHPAPGNEDGTLVNALLYHMHDLSGVGGVLRPGILHRLDKDTSGLLVVAKRDAAHLALSAQLTDRSLGRVYLAIVRTAPSPAQGSVCAPIGRHPKDRKKMAVVRCGGREATTHYSVLQPLRGASLVRCQLDTGRTHQIRVHMAHIGHPLLGDPLYAPAKPVYAIAGQALHAHQIHFLHPTTGRRMEFTAPPPDDFVRLLCSLGGQLPPDPGQIILP